VPKGDGIVFQNMAGANKNGVQTKPDLLKSRPRYAPTDDAHSREICSGGVGFETRSASGGRGAVLVAKLTRPVMHGVSVRVVGLPGRPPSRCFDDSIKHFGFVIR
jgi:hypothetical protein